MFKYRFSNNYDSKYKVKDRNIACFSGSKMKDMHPDGNFNVIGETILNNKKDKIGEIELGKEVLNISKEGKHSKLLFKEDGYILDESGGYIKLLKRRWLLLWLLIGFLLLGILVCFLLRPTNKPIDNKPDTPLELETTQDVYVKPEKPQDRSKNVTMPGWGSYTIRANTTEITEGFEFHNPESNTWYVDEFYFEGKYLENLVVDSGNKTDINHLLKLAGIKDSVKEIKEYDKSIFNLANEDNAFFIEAIKGNFDSSSIVVVAGDNEYKLDVKSKYDFYYMTFALYLEDNDELLYQSGLVEPSMYIQQMNISRALTEGEYDAYVFIQPYRSDRITKCNSGKVDLKLKVK